jgi:hypothetical protein
LRERERRKVDRERSSCRREREVPVGVGRSRERRKVDRERSSCRSGKKSRPS